MTPEARRRLPNRRMSETRDLEIAGRRVTATVGFALEARAGGGSRAVPREVFLSAGKEGSEIEALLGDAAVAISVALQNGVPASALARSVGRAPAGDIDPSDRYRARGTEPISAIGAALDWLCEFEGHSSWRRTSRAL